MNIREHNFWTWEALDIKSYRRCSPTDYFFASMGWFMFCAVVVLLPAGLLADFVFNSGWPMLPAAIVSVVAMWKGPVLGSHIHPLSGIPHHGQHRSNNLRNRGEEYLSLPPQDRALYPANILELLKDPDLTSQQRSTLDSAMRKVYDEVQERNRVRAALVKRHVDVDDIIERLHESATSVRECETETYRSELQKIKELSI